MSFAFTPRAFGLAMTVVSRTHAKIATWTRPRFSPALGFAVASTPLDASVLNGR